MEISENSVVQLALLFDPNEPEVLIRAKKWLIDRKGLNMCIELDEHEECFKQVFAVSAILQMTQDEIYFQDPTPNLNIDLTPQNEMKTLMTIKKKLNTMLISQELNNSQTRILELHLQHVLQLCNQFAARSTATPIKVLSNNSSPTIGKFLGWAQQNGMYTDIALAEFELTGRGVICTRDLKCDEIVFTLPEHLIVSADQALKCPKLGNLFTELKSQQLLDDEGALMLYFINETFHNPNSIWRPYLDILPTKEELPVAFYFNDDELNELSGLPILQEIQLNKQQFQHYFTEWTPIFNKYPEYFPPSVFTFDNYLWTRVIFDSRSFSFKKFKNCLLPFIDMMNTHPYAQIETRGFWNENSHTLQFRMLGDYIKGTELHLCYGPFSNRELLLYYGFVVPNNCYDKFPISFETGDENLTPVKRELLKHFGLSLEHYFRRDIIAPKLLATLRIIAADEEELKQLSDTQNPFTMLNPINEDRVLTALEDTAADLLNTINSAHNYVNENDLLTDQSLSAKKRLAVMYRKEIKAILTDTLRLVEMRSMINALLSHTS